LVIFSPLRTFTWDRQLNTQHFTFKTSETREVYLTHNFGLSRLSLNDNATIYICVCVYITRILIGYRKFQPFQVNMYCNLNRVSREYIKLLKACLIRRCFPTCIVRWNIYVRIFADEKISGFFDLCYCMVFSFFILNGAFFAIRRYRSNNNFRQRPKRELFYFLIVFKREWKKIKNAKKPRKTIFIKRRKYVYINTRYIGILLFIAFENIDITFVLYNDFYL